MIRFGGRRVATVCGSLGRIRLPREQERVGAEIHRLILHFSPLIADVVRVRQANDWTERGTVGYVLFFVGHFHAFCARCRGNAHAPSELQAQAD